MNLAALWRLPVLFVCENNGYAMTLSQERSTAGSLVERAAAFGMAAEAVDGMDVGGRARGRDSAPSRRRARASGPTFLECRTYRFDGHHTAERTMKLGYRTDDEIETLAARATRSSSRREARRRPSAPGSTREVEELLDEAVAFARSSPRPDAAEALDLVYASGLRPRDGVAA